jgi:hypothetical protein
MKKIDLSAPVASKKTAQNALYRLLTPMLTGFFRDNCWRAPGQIFNAINATGGTVEVQSTAYFAANGVECMGKRWILSVTANGFTFPAILTASFADKPNGDLYDLTFTV